MATITTRTKELRLEYPANAAEWPSANRPFVGNMLFSEAFDAESGDRPVWINITKIVPNNGFSISIGVS